MNYLLGRVIITNTMDDAVRLSKKLKNGARFVTLDGDVVNASGAITGGKYRNKTANLIERKAEISKLSIEFAKLNEEKNRLMAQKVANDKNKSEKFKEKEKLLGEGLADEAVDADLPAVRLVLVPVVIVLVLAKQTVIRSDIAFQVRVIRPGGMDHDALWSDGFACFVASVVRQK